METQKTSVNFFMDGKRKDERVWNSSDARGAQVIFSGGFDGLDDSVFGFSSLAEFEAWIATKPISAHEYSKGKAILGRTPKKITPEQERAISALQVNTTNKYAAEFNNLLSQARISHQDTQALLDFVTNYNPLTGPNVHSAFLYDGTGQTGQYLYLPKGWSFNRLDWLNFDNKCSSVKVFFGGVFLWGDINFTGRRAIVAGFPAKVVNDLGNYPYYFDNITSSVNIW